MDRLSRLASRHRPFVFLISFDKQEIIVEEIGIADAKICFAADGRYDPSLHAAITEMSPVPFSTYKEAFDAVIGEITRGNTYLLNLTSATPIRTDAPLETIYRAAKAPFKVWLKKRFVCFSPEPFVTITGDTIRTHPMKGTIDTSAPDAAQTILADGKEMAEHVMVVDLLRNDLSSVAKTVRVTSFRYLETVTAKERSLLQVSSTIEGKLPSNWPAHLGEIFDTLLPAGSVSGAPKRSTCDIIERVERYDRGFYTGIFGHFDGQNLTSRVLIRYIEQTSRGLVYKSGGGITIDSDAAKEYREMLDKIYIPA